MAASDRAGLSGSAPKAPTAAEGRRFGLTLGAGFAVVGLLVWWRGHPTAAQVAGVLALLSVLGGLAVPRHLGPVQRGWMALGLALSRITSPVFYSILYLVVLTPTALVRRTVGRSPLRRDPRATSYWVRREPATADERRRQLEHQF